MSETRLLKVSDIKISYNELLIAADIIKKGGLVAMPTETVYGLAANALDESAVAKIFVAKGRPQDNPLIVHISDFEMLDELVAEIPSAARLLAEHFWAGPLTMIMKKSDKVPYITSGGLETVAVRIPSHPIARELIRMSSPLAAPSANISGSPSPTTYQHCIDDLMGKVDAIICGDDCTYGVESTVISLVGEVPTILRPGAVTAEQLRAVLGDVAIDKAVLSKVSENQKVSSPGMKYKHYSPNAKIILIKSSKNDFVSYINNIDDNDVYGLVFTSEDKLINKKCLTYGDENNPLSQAHELFTRLRELDLLGAKTVYTRCPNVDGVGLAVYNRLIRAAGFEVIEI